VAHGEQYDFFLSRRGSVAAIAREVTDVLTEKGYKVLTQDYDIPLGASFIEAMHEAVKNSRDLVILFTHDYEQSPYTRKEFTSFEAERAQSAEERHIVVLRCEDVPLRGLLADNVYQDLVGIEDPQERKRRIIAAAERQSQSAPPPPRPFIGVPPRIASFTGRADELDRLDAILMHDKPAAVTQAVGRAAVQGMGGVGKTSLAVEYAHRYRNLYAGVCWCPAETRTGLSNALAGLGVTLGAAAPDEADVDKVAKAALGRLADQRARWLLVYDNVSSPDDIADLLPPAGARALITSRFSDWSELAEEVALDGLSSEEAVAFLQSRTVRRDASGASILAEALGNLPLALDHAAAYCKRTQMRFPEFAVKVSSLIANVPRGAGYPRSVATTFDFAISHAVSECAKAEALMAFLAQCAPERIPMMLVEGVIADEAERLQALAALVEVSLVKHDPFEDGTPAVTVHRLVQTVARVRAEANGMAHGAVERIIARLATLYPHNPSSNPNSWPLCAKVTPHLLALKAAEPEGVSQSLIWSELLRRAGSYFYGRASYMQAAPLLRNALSVCEKVLGPEDRLTATNLSSLSLLLQTQGDFAAARPLCERALAIRERLGPGHPDTATSLNDLARLLQGQGDLKGAQPLYERALAINENVLGPKSNITGVSLSNLASLVQAQGDFASARPLFERALAIFAEVHGPEHPVTAGGLRNLGALLHDQGDATAAQPLLERAVTIAEKVLGWEHPQTNLSRHKLAQLHLAGGQTAEALALAEAALVAHNKVLGPNHPWAKDSARVTADALDALGRADEAKVLRERYGIAGPEKSNT
jgi:tetratricopeptide (TPR) repeat protein